MTNVLLDEPSVWYSRDFENNDEWIHRLTIPEIKEIESATKSFLKLNIPLEDMTKEGFPLPGLAPVLQNIRKEILLGRGFKLIKGFPVEQFSNVESVITYWGVGLYLGDAVPQNGKGHLLGHVINLGYDPTDPVTRIYSTNCRQPYHTDSCDVVGLLCLQVAKEGGLSSFSSSTTIYNEMLASRPDLVEVLSKPYYVDRKKEIPEGKKPYYKMAVFHKYQGHINTIYARDFIEVAHNLHSEIPRLTDIQIEALDMFDALAGREDIRLDMVLEPGDIQLLHNHQIVHSRTCYKDYPEIDRRRHLLRLWLSETKYGRKLPEIFAERYGNFHGEKRGGIYLPGVKQKIPLNPE